METGSNRIKLDQTCMEKPQQIRCVYCSKSVWNTFDSIQVILKNVKTKLANEQSTHKKYPNIFNRFFYDII